MTKEEAKQYLRNQLDSCVKKEYNKDVFYLCYNKSYLRALKLSTITGNPVNKENFKPGEKLFRINTKSKTFLYFNIISIHLYENYSTVYSIMNVIVEEVLNEYEEYKYYNSWQIYG